MKKSVVDPLVDEVPGLEWYGHYLTKRFAQWTLGFLIAKKKRWNDKAVIALILHSTEISKPRSGTVRDVKFV